MDFFKSILEVLPLEKLSDILGEIVIWWSQIVSGVAPDSLPMYAYMGGSIIVLLLWLLVARMLPRPLGGMTWMMLFAILLAPGSALGDPGTIAPASISVVYALMMKDTAGAVSNALPVLVVLVVGLFVGFLWQLIRGAFETSLDRARQSTAADTQATMQLTSGSYLPENTAVENQSAKDKLVQATELLPFAILKKSAAKREAAKIVTSVNAPIVDIAVKDSAPKATTTASKTNDIPKVSQQVKNKSVEGSYSKHPIRDNQVKQNAAKQPLVRDKSNKKPIVNKTNKKPIAKTDDASKVNQPVKNKPVEGSYNKHPIRDNYVKQNASKQPLVIDKSNKKPIVDKTDKNSIAKNNDIIKVDQPVKHKPVKGFYSEKSTAKTNDATKVNQPVKNKPVKGFYSENSTTKTNDTTKVNQPVKNKPVKGFYSEKSTAKTNVTTKVNKPVENKPVKGFYSEKSMAKTNGTTKVKSKPVEGFYSQKPTTKTNGTTVNQPVKNKPVEGFYSKKSVKDNQVKQSAAKQPLVTDKSNKKPIVDKANQKPIAKTESDDNKTNKKP